MHKEFLENILHTEFVWKLRMILCERGSVANDKYNNMSK